MVMFKCIPNPILKPNLIPDPISTHNHRTLGIAAQGIVSQYYLTCRWPDERI